MAGDQEVDQLVADVRLAEHRPAVGTRGEQELEQVAVPTQVLDTAGSDDPVGDVVQLRRMPAHLVPVPAIPAPLAAAVAPDAR